MSTLTLELDSSLAQSLERSAQREHQPVATWARERLRMAVQETEIERIQHTPGVCGGEACVRSTRIAVWMLESARRAGVSDSGLLQDYPSLDARDLAAAWSYAEAHSEEINRAIQANHDA